MPRPASRLTPQQNIQAEVARRGPTDLVAGCAALISGDYTDAALIRALGGLAAERLLDGRPHADTYWFRVWATRGLLWIWQDQALDAILAATRDQAWRVREMSAKVVARHLLGDALPAMVGLRDDPVPRVRSAAVRAVTALTRAGA